MLHPLGLVQLPINEPASANSQIQEFLDLNRGAGIQHIALETENLVETIARLRQNGLALIRVPETYYSQLRERPGLPISEAILQAIAAQEILIDWQDDSHSAALLQIFTEPIFDQPTVFLELIERQTSLVNGQLRRAYGFGEGNFRALFEAIERQQIQRGSLDE
jgi:4-hydroxyphenylpyruvate dioxygenase